MKSANVVWYWEYTAKIWNTADSQEEIRSGIVSACNMTQATKILENDYYGEELMEIHMLKPIIDVVFEFDYVNSDCDDFDFIITKKEK